MSYVTQSQVFNNDSIWTVPPNVYSVTIQAIGGGGGGFGNNVGGGGGLVRASFTVVPITKLYIYIGGPGLTGFGFNNGKSNYNAGAGNGGLGAAGGGGGALTCVTINNNNMLIIAGGGGGGGNYIGNNIGGYGGGNNNADGGDGAGIYKGSGGKANGMGGTGGGGIGSGGTGSNNGNIVGIGQGANSVGNPGGGGGYGGGGGSGDSNFLEFTSSAGGGSSFVNNLLSNNTIPIQFQYVSNNYGSGAGGINGNPGQVIITWIQPPQNQTQNCNANPCPPPIYSKPSTSFGGNTNMPTHLNTKAFRYSQLVSLPFRARGSGTVIFINNNNAINKNVQPPRNKF